MSILNAEQKEKMKRKKRYYNAHPKEAVEDHIKAQKSGSDAFIMKKVEEWEITQS